MSPRPAAQRSQAEGVFLGADRSERARRPYPIDWGRLAVDQRAKARAPVQRPTPLQGIGSLERGRLRDHHRTQLVDQGRHQRGTTLEAHHIKARLRPQQDTGLGPARPARGLRGPESAVGGDRGTHGGASRDLSYTADVAPKPCRSHINSAARGLMTLSPAMPRRPGAVELVAARPRRPFENHQKKTIADFERGATHPRPQTLAQITARVSQYPRGRGATGRLIQIMRLLDEVIPAMRPRSPSSIASSPN
jgi:hypothetical protein